MADSSASTKAKLGMIGLGVMGQNLSLNIEEHGYPIAVWNRTADEMQRMLAANPGKRLIGTRTLPELVASLERPRRILMLVKAGAPVDSVIDGLRPLLERGDILIDCGNSLYTDTQRREAALKNLGLNFFGSGVSGGEEGARHGPSLMPGGNRAAYEHVRAIFEAIAAKTDSGPCVTYVGPDGAGHFVKMVHNGIEYGDMQLIAEAYDVLRRLLGLRAGELAEIFSEWNRGSLESFLIELTAQVLTVIDAETQRPLVDMVLDKAGQKGTGKWTAQVALDLGVPIPTIAAAIDARVLSSLKDERVAAAKKIRGPVPGGVDEKTRAKADGRAIVAAVHDALHAAKICSYAQGMSLIQKASDQHHWDIQLAEMARIWKGGCIIRARLLDAIMSAYARNPSLQNLLLDEDFSAVIDRAQAGWRMAVKLAQQNGIPVPALAASLSYFDSYRTASLPQNLTQAQRDAFGSHLYERADHPERGFIHTDWIGQARR
ncbi:MAG: NADP-dependent phosphogluconate dehydrogenase [Planctomycetota bacterium]